MKTSIHPAQGEFGAEQSKALKGYGVLGFLAVFCPKCSATHREWTRGARWPRSGRLELGDWIGLLGGWAAELGDGLQT